jgi:hypothetical protein
MKNFKKTSDEFIELIVRLKKNFGDLLGTPKVDSKKTKNLTPLKYFGKNKHLNNF